MDLNQCVMNDLWHSLIIPITKVVINGHSLRSDQHYQRKSTLKIEMFHFMLPNLSHRQISIYISYELSIGESQPQKGTTQKWVKDKPIGAGSLDFSEQYLCIIDDFRNVHSQIVFLECILINEHLKSHSFWRFLLIWLRWQSAFFIWYMNQTFCLHHTVLLQLWSKRNKCWEKKLQCDLF